MLTTPLLRVRTRGRELTPSFVKPDQKGLREAVETLLDTFRESAEHSWTRAQLDEELELQLGQRRDVKLMRGLAKVLFDRSEFEVQAAISPVELRAKVFTLAQERGPLALESGALQRPTAPI